MPEQDFLESLIGEDLFFRPRSEDAAAEQRAVLKVLSENPELLNAVLKQYEGVIVPSGLSSVVPYKASS